MRVRGQRDADFTVTPLAGDRGEIDADGDEAGGPDQDSAVQLRGQVNARDRRIG